MAQRLRLIVLTLAVLMAGGIGVRLAAQQAAGGTPPPTPPPAPAQAPAGRGARQLSPAEQKIADAQKIQDADQRLEALRAVEADTPAVARQRDTAILSTIIAAHPDRADDLEKGLDAVLADIPSAATPDARLSQVLSAVAPLVDKKLALAKVESVVTDSYNQVDFGKIADAMKAQAKAANRPEPSTAALDNAVKAPRVRALETLGRVHVAMGQFDRGEKELRDALAINPELTTTMLALAEAEAAHGNDAAALDEYFDVAVHGRLKLADEATMRGLYRKIHGSDAGFEDAWDKAAREKAPNPVEAEKYKKASDRSDRLVLVEMFTGSGCPPCVAADLALDGLLERYGSDDIAVLAYHVHIPQPDPMTVPGSVARKDYYAVPGVPTIHIDGGPGGNNGQAARAGQPPTPHPSAKGDTKVGGGGRDNAPALYNDYVKFVDAELTRPADGAISVKAAIAGDTVNVTADVSKVSGDAKDLTLNIVLAERQLRFSGENGIRFHHLVVRGVAGDDKPGLPVTLENGKATLHASFDLNAIRDQITKSLAEEITKRRDRENAAETKPATPAEYRAEGHPYTDIDTSQLTVVAFLQGGDGSVLQAARVDVKK